MSTIDVRTNAPSLPRLSPSRLEAWDRCPAAYRFAHVLRLPQPIGDQRPGLLGSVTHALLERHLREALRSGTRPPLATVSGLAAALVEEGDVPDASTELIREATELVTRWLTLWAVPVEHLVAVEHALAVDASGRRVAWEAPDAFIRGRLDLVGVEQQHATVLLAADGRTLAAFLKRRPDVEQTLAGAWTPSAAWFGHRKAKMAGVAAVKFGRPSDDSGTAPETLASAGRDHDIPSRTDRRSAEPRPPGKAT